jgi:translation initiation factor 2A
MVNNEVQFYENGDLQQIKHKIHIQKVSDFGLSPSRDKPHVMTYVPGSKGAPSFAKLYAYPNFEDTQVVASKSFFQADKMEVKWNNSGIYVLLLTQADLDKTGSSYYGKQQLHFLSTKGDSSMVGLSKEGPIYSVEWSPNGSEFCVVYGYMPAKTTLFNCKTDPIFDFGTGPRSVGLFNGQGNILMIGGFGNLRGKVEMWDVSDSKNCQSLAQFDATDTTDVKWSPDGQRLMTSTCAPRLRVGNGYKVWHYSGSLLHEKHFATGDELWEVDWQAAPPGQWPTFKASKKAVTGIAPSQPQASKQAYRPPGARGTASTFKLHDDEQLPQNMINLIDQKNKGNTGNVELSKSALKNKKRKEAAKKKRDEEEAAATSHNVEGGNPDKITTNLAANNGTGDQEKDKKIRKIKDKLSSIQKLKQDQAQGKKLEANQLDKINKEGDLLKELKELKI